MSTKVLKPIKGRLLVSVPFLTDTFFGRSVVLLTEHNEQGSVGFILNKPFETDLNKAIKDFPDFGANLYIGGPVENTSLFYLHTIGERIEGSVEVKEGLFWGGNFDTIKFLIENKQIEPEDIKFFVGYSGWSPKQLDRELQENSWVVTESTIENIMDENPVTLWNDIIKTSKKEFAVWADYPVNPSLN